MRRQWWLIVGGLILGMAAGVATFVLLPKAYESTTAVLVSPLATPGTAGSNSSLNMDTELQLVRSATVGERAATALGRPDAGGAVLARLSLFVPPNSTVIEITYEGTTGESAQAGAEAVADAYLGAREDAALAVVDQQIAALNLQRDRLAERATELRTQLEDASEGSTVEQRLLIDLDSTLRRIADLDAQVAALETSSVTPGLVITEAPEPRRPSSPDPVLLVASTAMLGLLAGLAAGGARHLRASQRIGGVEQVQRLDGVEHVFDLRGAEGPTSAGFPVGPGFERALSWRERAVGSSCGGIVVTSTRVNSDQGAVAAGLADAAARRQGSAVVVVVDPASSLLARGNHSSTVIRQFETGRTSIQTGAGRAAYLSAVPADARSVTLTGEFVDQVAELTRRHVVVVDASALQASSDVYAFWDCCDTVVVVVTANEKARALAQAVARLRTEMAGRVVAVLVD